MADLAACKGKEPEKCSCETKCADGAANGACPVCVADVSKCAGKEPAPPVCACSVKCAAGAVNVACPVCKLDMTGCMGKAPEPTTPPEPEYTITILSPSGWYTKAADVEIRVEDVNGTGWQKVEYKIERGGSWIDLTDDLTDRNRAKVEITENCTLYVTVTDKDGKAHTKSRYIECFDRTAPTVKAGIDGRLLRVEASDELSGVDAIFIDGDRYGDLTNGTLDVRLRDLGDDYSQLSIQAVDYAGNKSKTVQVKNPNYKEPEKDKDGFTICNDKVKTLDYVNVRTSPSTDGEIYQEVANDVELDRIGYNDEWSKVSIDGGEYYIFSELLEVVGGGDKSDASTEATTENSSDASTEQGTTSNVSSS